MRDSFNPDDFKTLIEYCKSKALKAKVAPDEESIYRSYCREYSIVFNTPFFEVYNKLDPQIVILAVMEHHLEDVDPYDDMERILEEIYSLQDPDYANTKREEFKEFIKEAEAEEEKRLAEGRPIHKSLVNEVSLSNNPSAKTPTPPTSLPQSGGINLSYLENEENGQSSEDF